MKLNIFLADLEDPLHCEGILEVLNSYASDPVGGGEPLRPAVLKQLIPGLRSHPTTSVMLAADAGRIVGMAVCFFGFSTFQARRLLNIHDLAVVPEYRGRGVGRALLREVEAHAITQDCCKLTLEVQHDNARARGLYESFGFRDFLVAGSATQFMSKPLASPRP